MNNFSFTYIYMTSFIIVLIIDYFIKEYFYNTKIGTYYLIYKNKQTFLLSFFIRKNNINKISFNKYVF